MLQYSIRGENFVEQLIADDMQELNATIHILLKETFLRQTFEFPFVSMMSETLSLIFTFRSQNLKGFLAFLTFFSFNNAI